MWIPFVWLEIYTEITTDPEMDTDTTEMEMATEPEMVTYMATEPEMAMEMAPEPEMATDCYRDGNGYRYYRYGYKDGNGYRYHR